MPKVTYNQPTGQSLNGAPIYASGVTPATPPAPAAPAAPTTKYALNPDGKSYSTVPTEPAVISSSMADDAIASAKTRLANISTKGTQIGGDGNTYYSDGSMAGAPPEATYNEGSGQYEYNGKNYGVSEFYGNDTTPGDDEYTAVQNLFAPLKANLDANTLSQVNAIQQQFESLKAQQQQFNQTAEKATSRALLLGGSSRYAPLDASGTMLAKTSYGLQQIQDLDAKENMAIAQAQAAQQDGDMKLMTQALSMAEGIRKDKQAQAASVMDTIQKANDAMKTARMQASRDDAIAGLVTQGITDPAQMIDLLNNYEDGTPTGGDFTSKEISDALKSFTVDGKDTKNLSADLQTFQYIRDNYGLPKEISDLPENQQYFAYLAALKKANTAPKTAVAPKSSSTSSPSDPNAPTWEEYLAAAQKAAGVNYFMSPEEDQLKAQYQDEYGAHEKFTTTELKKLEQAGLSKATRKEQLDYLYGKKTEATDTSGSGGEQTP